MWQHLLGSLCVLCRRSVAGGEAEHQLCHICLADLPWLEDSEIAPPGPSLARQIAVFAYTGAPRDWVIRTKHDRGLVAARVLGTLLADVLLDAYPAGSATPEVLIPVPLSLRRLLRRGHNQAALIAVPVARRLRLRLLLTAASRRRHTALQPGLDPVSRRRNVAGAFDCRRRWQGETLAIIDDVVTTGATASALAEALLAVGAGEVHLWSPTLAHTHG